MITDLTSPFLSVARSRIQRRLILQPHLVFVQQVLVARIQWVRLRPRLCLLLQPLDVVVELVAVDPPHSAAAKLDSRTVNDVTTRSRDGRLLPGPEHEMRWRAVSRDRVLPGQLEARERILLHHIRAFPACFNHAIQRTLNSPHASRPESRHA